MSIPSSITQETLVVWMQHVAFGQLLVSGIFVETVIALISKKKPVSVLHNTLVLEDIGPLRHSSKSERSLQTPKEGDDLKLCE